MNKIVPSAPPLTVSVAALGAACAVARRWLGATPPNPPVGAAALDAAGNLLGVAAHQRAGEGHAEALLLQQLRTAGMLAQVQTLCVTLEPCNHHGRTPPCCEAIIAAKIPQVVIGAHDPNPHVAGGGAARLRAADVIVTELNDPECQAVLYAFKHSVTTGRPWVTVKRAFTAAGSMVPPLGQKTFTSPEALRLAHQLRRRADAILTGSGTVLADNPDFTVRHVPDHAGKTRLLAILDRRRRVPPDYLAAAAQRGLQPILYDSLDAAIADLGRRQCRDVLVEAGSELSAAVLASDYWCQEVRIQQALPDSVTVRYHPTLAAMADWPLEWMLPQETE